MLHEANPAIDRPAKPARRPVADRLVAPERAAALKALAVDWISCDLNVRQLCELELLLNGGFAPLDGYIGLEAWRSVMDSMRLPDGSLWPLPVTLDLPMDMARRIEPGATLALRDREGFMLAALHVDEIWLADLEREAEAVFGTADPERHPGVRRFYEEKQPWYASGRLEGLHLPQHYDFTPLRRTPAQTAALLDAMGWERVLGVLSRSFPHCSHRESYLASTNRLGAGILMQTMVMEPMPREAEHFTRVRCVDVFLRRFPKGAIAHGLLPWAHRSAGPREALMQAMVLGNYGATHVLVADDEADPLAVHNGTMSQRFYPRGAAQELVQDAAQETGVAMEPLTRMVWAASEVGGRYLPEEKARAVACDSVEKISSAELCRRLEFGLDIPEWFSDPEVAAEMRRTFPPRWEQGFTILLTGLSGAGKSTIAKVLYVKLMEDAGRPVTLLDGDIVRRNLSSELTFTREHRNLNVTRIGFVASEITKNGGIAICAPIAPYAESRRQCRELIEAHGGYVEVHIATPLDVCEQRDRKGLYAKARAGVVSGVTGIDDPYEPPQTPEVRIDTSCLSPDEAAERILRHLREQAYLR